MLFSATLFFKKNENNEVIQIEYKESFTGFYPIKNDRSAEGLQNFITSFLEEKNISIKKCRGQGYDGAAVMSGAYKGLQSKIVGLEKNAQYIHCAAHNLNLVLNDAVNGVLEAKSFFDVVGRIYNFFSNSVKRWELLNESPVSKITLKRLNPTRWSSRNDSMDEVRFNFKDILKALIDIILKSKNSEEKSEAIGLKKKIENFEFLFLIILFSKILHSINIVSKLLQSKNSNIGQASNLFKNAYEELCKLRQKYDEIRREASDLAANWRIDPIFVQKRQKNRQNFFMNLHLIQSLQQKKNLKK